MNVVQTRLQGGMYKYFVYNTHVTRRKKYSPKISCRQENLACKYSVFNTQVTPRKTNIDKKFMLANIFYMCKYKKKTVLTFLAKNIYEKYYADNYFFVTNIWSPALTSPQG